MASQMDSMIRVMQQAKSAFDSMTHELQTSVDRLTKEAETLRRERDAYAVRWPMEPGAFDALRTLVRETADRAEKQGISRASFIAVTYLTLCGEAEVRRSVYIPHRMEAFARSWIKTYSIPAYVALRDKQKLRQFDDFFAWAASQGYDHRQAGQMRKWLVLLTERKVLSGGMVSVSRTAHLTPPERKALDVYRRYLASKKAV